MGWVLHLLGVTECAYAVLILGDDGFLHSTLESVAFGAWWVRWTDSLHTTGHVRGSLVRPI